jgi:ankyrin repeat protein
LKVLIDAGPRPEIFTLPLPQYDLGGTTVVRTPLQLAVSVKSLPAFRMLSPLAPVRTLLKNDKTRRILLHLAASVDFKELIDEYARHGWLSSIHEQAMMDAATHGHAKLTLRLLDYFDLLENCYNYQALQMASRNGHTSIVEMLFSRS